MCSPKHKIPYQNPSILYKNLKNTNLSQITRNPTKTLKSHQNTQTTPNTTKTLKSHQRLPKIVRLPPRIPKYLGRARPSQNSRAWNIWVGHALQKEGPLQEKKNMVWTRSFDDWKRIKFWTNRRNSGSKQIQIRRSTATWKSQKVCLPRLDPVNWLH